MNYKLLMPSYRTRFRTIMDALERLTAAGGFRTMLDLGCGEGDYDCHLKQYTAALYACDISADDIAFCKTLNPDVAYAVEDAMHLHYPDAFFDCVVCVDVLEHTSDRTLVIREMHRILKKDCYALVSVPQRNFPVSYDPVNTLLAHYGKQAPYGAFGYGHASLPEAGSLENDFINNRFSITGKKYLSKSLVGLLEMYWAGLLQSLFKSNSGNAGRQVKRKKMVIRPDTNKDVPLLKVIDWIIKTDECLYKKSDKSIGIFYLLKRE